MEKVFDFFFAPLSSVTHAESAGLEKSGFRGWLILVTVFDGGLVQPWLSF